VSTDEILDQVVIPRPNGSDALTRVASFIAERLEENGAEVTLHAFTATPHGFQLAWTVALALMLAYFASIAQRRYVLALLFATLTPVLLLLEFELLWSPISGLLPLVENNVVGTFAGRAGGPTLIFCAHYDTTTHFGDHMSWGPWGWRLGPATGLAFGIAFLGLWCRRRRRELPRWLALPAAALVLVPFTAMAWFQAVGPLVRAPSPGALDNGGSVAALLRWSEALATRPADAPMTLKLVFLAAEEERALGSWAYAQTLVDAGPLAVVNLESIGAADDLAYISEDGFALRRYRSPDALIAFVNATARERWGAQLAPRELPVGTLTDGRSFLAHGIPALTLRAYTGDAFPRNLHSSQDSRERLSVAAVERSAELLQALVERVDADPGLADAFVPARDAPGG
jgi:acetylornithine deacetylase/succinyl-diaminopimelate desuccinylase-like protein